MFVSFEGLDGSGKTTQLDLLEQRLRTLGRAVTRVREPGGTALGEAVRGLLLDPAMEITPRAELLLFSAARAQLCEAVIQPALDRGDVVLADRFFDSTTAYQGGGREVAAMAWLNDFHPVVTGGLAPIRTFLLRLDPDTALARRAHRAADRMEASGEAFYRRVAAAYDALAAAHPGRVRVLDATLPPDTLHAAICADLGLSGRS